MNEELENIETGARKTWKVVIAFVGGVTALIGLFASVATGVNWLLKHHRHTAEYRAQMAMAESQKTQKQYAAALSTYQEILKLDPQDKAALDGELDAAMTWVENFSVYTPEGNNSGDISRSALDQIFPVLTSALSSVQSPRLPDVQAHIGWAHFLDAKMTGREDDSVAQDYWRQALTNDRTNVYANAMLGNWMLQSGGSLSEANEHFRVAVSTRQMRPLVRRLQIGGLLHFETPGARGALVRVADEMRRGSEVIEPELRQRIVGWCFDPTVVRHQELSEALGAVPFADAWSTYSWLVGDSTLDAGSSRTLTNEFIHANLLELAGQRDASLDEYRRIDRELGSHPGGLRDQVSAAIKRLTES